MWCRLDFRGVGNVTFKLNYSSCHLLYLKSKGSNSPGRRTCLVQKYTHSPVALSWNFPMHFFLKSVVLVPTLKHWLLLFNHVYSSPVNMKALLLSFTGVPFIGL